MDRSLQFFLNGPNPQTQPDSKTGLSTSTTEVQFDVTTYDPNDPNTATNNEKRNINYTLVNSLQSEGQFINYLGNSATNDFRPITQNPEHESDIKLSNIIQWSQENKPALKLNAFQFAYLKNFNTYPANRLMILRRFPEAVPHDIFNTQVKATNTMVSYYDLEKSPFTLGFNEEWERFDKSIMELIQDVIGIKFDSIPVVGDVFKAAQNATPSNLQQELLAGIGKRLGLVTTGDNLYGDPNVIYKAAIRTADGENVSTGLNSTINIDFETTYVMLEANGVDAKAAMLDIIANAIHMGTSNARFILTHNASDGLNEIIREMEQGNVEGLLSNILEGLSEAISGVTDILKDLIGSTSPSGNPTAPTSSFGDRLGELASQILRNRFSRYKWQMRGAIGALSGMHTAPWHISIGNPKCPWFTCGNLIVKSVNLDFGGELGYNDMPTEVKVTIKLESGRPLGANEIASLFNNGRGRIYDTPEKLQKIYVPTGQAYKLNGNENTESPTNNQKNKSNISNQNLSNDVSDNDLANNVPNTSDFSLNNSDVDNNLNPLN